MAVPTDADILNVVARLRRAEGIPEIPVPVRFTAAVWLKVSGLDVTVKDVDRVESPNKDGLFVFWRGDVVAAEFRESEVLGWVRHDRAATAPS